MAKKKIEEMNEQELVAEKAANPKIEVVNDASKATTEHPVIIPDAKETASFKTSALDTTLNKNATKPTTATPVKQKSDYLIRREEGANRAQQAYNNFVETFGRKPTEDEVSATLGKDLYSWQYVNNKAGNWGNAFGGRELFGQVHGNTMAGLDKNYQTWKAQQKVKETEESKKPMVGMVKIQDGSDTKDVYISKDNQRAAKLIGNSIIDANNISPEVANRYRALFMEMGVPVGSEYTESTTLGNIIQGVDDDVLEMLGFYDEETGALKVPHQETYEEILARRERAEEALRLQAQQRELDRQQARLGLADLAAGIGDMIKASNGAIVTPRDYRAMYNSLTEQQKTNYNNYLARMQALKEQEKAKQKEAADRAYQEKMLATQHERDMEKLLQAQGFQAGESALDRDLKRELLEKELKAKEAIAKLGEDAEVAKKVTAAQLEAMKSNVNIPVGDKTYTFGNKEASNAAINAMHGKLWNVLIDEDGKYKPPYSTIIKNLEGNGVEKTEQLRAVVNAALNSDEVLNNPTLLKEIQMYMTQASNGVDAPPTGGKTYVDGNGNEITEAQWLAKSPSDRKLYKEKTN